jgi:hypothetical protein
MRTFSNNVDVLRAEADDWPCAAAAKQEMMKSAHAAVSNGDAMRLRASADALTELAGDLLAWTTPGVRPLKFRISPEIIVVNPM